MMLLVIGSVAVYLLVGMSFVCAITDGDAVPPSLQERSQLTLLWPAYLLSLVLLAAIWYVGELIDVVRGMR